MLLPDSKDVLFCLVYGSQNGGMSLTINNFFVKDDNFVFSFHVWTTWSSGGGLEFLRTSRASTTRKKYREIVATCDRLSHRLGINAKEASEDIFYAPNLIP